MSWRAALRVHAVRILPLLGVAVLFGVPERALAILDVTGRPMAAHWSHCSLWQGQAQPTQAP